MLEQIKNKILLLAAEQIPILNSLDSNYDFEYGQSKIFKVEYTIKNLSNLSVLAEEVINKLSKKLIDDYNLKIFNLIQNSAQFISTNLINIFRLIDSNQSSYIILNEYTLSKLEKVEFYSIPIKNRIINKFVSDDNIYFIYPNALEFNLISKKYSINHEVNPSTLEQTFTLYRPEELKVVNKSGIINILLEN